MFPTERWRRPVFDTNQAVPRSSRQWNVAELLRRTSDTNQASVGLSQCKAVFLTGLLRRAPHPNTLHLATAALLRDYEVNLWTYQDCPPL
jgi:hypothetical protein